MRVRRGGGPVGVAAAVAMILLAGCDGAPPGGQRTADGVPIVREAKDMPELPLHRYQFTAEDDEAYGTLKRAQKLLAQRCMRDFGFADFPRDPKSPNPGALAIVAVNQDPAGEFDLEKARRWGYGWDPKRDVDVEPAGRRMTVDESYVYWGHRTGGRPTILGRRVPEEGCLGRADTRLYRGVRDIRRTWAYVARREVVLEKAAMKDRRMRQVLKAWSQCVVDKGLKRYATPDDAFRDKAWKRGNGGNTSHSRRERNTAVADVECKREHNTAGVWWSVLSKEQRTDLARHRSAYESVRRGQETVRDNMREVLATK
ncbi:MULTISPECIES: hypothetical protein [unclassified Streptomyces]|uniref:hypothetical protein n=2 Tax=unclassified Streptomyces TaxID=2593676 RepID=UPI002258370B|nr:hypothetical protein [Streptomyces sp. NBC_00401]